MKHSIIVALDEHSQENFDDVLSQLDPGLCMVKIGSVSFNSLGRECVLKAATDSSSIFCPPDAWTVIILIGRSTNPFIDFLTVFGMS